ncbi:hypothetical protein HMPREF0813_01491 [Streptococcus anginosus F0211]|uniref:Uncharacterized protein n=1 Tax=Streptococcus anginosus F0211 TaxID=706437 RepID=E6J2K1_STRAP|nr:hypothetical protein HMPREF0813_01491 [Streptococcus anginosus F0211]
MINEISQASIEELAKTEPILFVSITQEDWFGFLSYLVPSLLFDFH